MGRLADPPDFSTKHMSRVTKLAALWLVKWSFFVKNGRFLDLLTAHVPGPPGAPLTCPGHFLDLLASISDVSNAAGVPTGPRELGDLKGT